MAEMSTANRGRPRDLSFAYVDKDGERHLPLNDNAHVRNAIAQFDQTDFDTGSAKRTAARKVMRAAKRRRIEVSDDNDIAKAAKR
jgi:hypothetical protein